MVKALHRAGIEVILDVVYNHTGEGNHLGPTLSLRGIDNARLLPARPGRPARYYVDFTGTGNSLNMQHPRTVQLIMDSLRYWVSDMHVDGFRFDLAPVLARELYEVDRLAAFFDIMQQDPTLSQREADRRAVGRGPGRLPGRQLPGRLGRVERRVPRHRARDSGAATAGRLAELASRLSGSSDLYAGERPAHLRERQLRHRARRLHPHRPRVSYEHKHNEANGEDNRDGTDENLQPQLGRRGRRPTTPPSTTCASG